MILLILFYSTKTNNTDIPRQCSMQKEIKRVPKLNGIITVEIAIWKNKIPYVKLPCLIDTKNSAVDSEI